MWVLAENRAIVVLLLLLVAGCSERQIYESIQLNRQFECSQLPVVEQQACLDEYSESYDSYKRARDEAVGEGGGASD